VLLVANARKLRLIYANKHNKDDGDDKGHATRTTTTIDRN
jgi:hypothetical protein